MKLAAIVLLAAGLLALVALGPGRSWLQSAPSRYRRRRAEVRIERELARLAA